MDYAERVYDGVVLWVVCVCLEFNLGVLVLVIGDENVASGIGESDSEEESSLNFVLTGECTLRFSFARLSSRRKMRLLMISLSSSFCLNIA